MYKYILMLAIGVLSIAITYLLPSQEWAIGLVTGSILYGVYDHFQGKEAR